MKVVLGHIMDRLEAMSGVFMDKIGNVTTQYEELSLSLVHNRRTFALLEPTGPH